MLIWFGVLQEASVFVQNRKSDSAGSRLGIYGGILTVFVSRVPTLDIGESNDSVDSRSISWFHSRIYRSHSIQASASSVRSCGLHSFFGHHICNVGLCRMVRGIH